LGEHNGAVYTELFHEHFPAHRMSQETSIEMMKALVLAHGQFAPHYILRCYLNKRGREPESSNPFQITPEYPKRGVVRWYCGAGAIQAWVDAVIDPERFRQP
jgi:hypothetical protein